MPQRSDFWEKPEGPIQEKQSGIANELRTKVSTQVGPLNPIHSTTLSKVRCLPDMVCLLRKRRAHNLPYEEAARSSLGGCGVYQSGTSEENEYNNSMMLFSIFSSLFT